MATYCKHCGYHIVKMNYSGGPEWVHQPPGAAFQDNTNLYCATTIATPGRVVDSPYAPDRVDPNKEN